MSVAVSKTEELEAIVVTVLLPFLQQQWSKTADMWVSIVLLGSSFVESDSVVSCQISRL